MPVISPEKIATVLNVKTIISIPVFNEEQYISETLNSVINQTISNFIVIISDNCSTDRTGEICKYYADIYPNIYYTKLPQNIGAAKNFLFLRDNTNAKYQMWLGGHDLISPNYIKNAVELLDNTPEAVIAQANLITFWRDQQSFIKVPDHSSLSSIERVFASMCCDQWCIQINQLMRKEIMQRVPLFKCPGQDRIFLTYMYFCGTVPKVKDGVYATRTFPNRHTLKDTELSIRVFNDKKFDFTKNAHYRALYYGTMMMRLPNLPRETKLDMAMLAMRLSALQSGIPMKKIKKYYLALHQAGGNPIRLKQALSSKFYKHLYTYEPTSLKLFEQI